jgi:hypothetical protein
LDTCFGQRKYFLSDADLHSIISRRTFRTMAVTEANLDESVLNGRRRTSRIILAVGDDRAGSRDLSVEAKLYHPRRQRSWTPIAINSIGGAGTFDTFFRFFLCGPHFLRDTFHL